MVSTYTYLAYESCPSLSSNSLAAKKGQSRNTNINRYSTGKSERLTGATVPQGLRRPRKWTSTQVWALNGNVNFTNSTRKTFQKKSSRTYLITVSYHTFFHTNIPKFLFGFLKHRARWWQSADGLTDEKSACRKYRYSILHVCTVHQRRLKHLII